MKAKRILRTKLCDLLDIEYPVILAGMGAPQGDPLLSASRAELVAAVSNAGGLGVIGATRFTPEELREEIRETKELTDRPFGVDVLLPEMVSVSGPALESKTELPKSHVDFVNRLKKEIGIPDVRVERPVLTWDQIKQQVDIILEEHVPVFAAGLGNPGWVVPRAHAQGTKVIGVVGNVKNALRLAEAGVDIIVAQGHEGGGHTGRIGTLALVPQVVDAASPIPVLAAGGIADGRGLVAALALGAVGVWCGTVFLATYEANVHDYHQSKILDATEEDTRWMKFYTGKTSRQVYNKWIQAWEEAGMTPLPYPLQGLLIAEAQQGLRDMGLTDYLSGYVGQICGMITEVKSAKQVIDEMIEGAIRLLKATLPTEVVSGSMEE